MFSLSAVETLRVVLRALDGWVLTLASPLAVAPLSEAETSMFSSMVALAATSVDNNRSSGSGEDGFSAADRICIAHQPQALTWALTGHFTL